MAYAVWFGLFENRWECHFNVINYAVQNPTVNIMKDFFERKRVKFRNQPKSGREKQPNEALLDSNN
jgi:hypothetical protein